MILGLKQQWGYLTGKSTQALLHHHDLVHNLETVAYRWSEEYQSGSVERRDLLGACHRRVVWKLHCDYTKWVSLRDYLPDFVDKENIVSLLGDAESSLKQINPQWMGFLDLTTLPPQPPGPLLHVDELFRRS